MLCSQSDVCIRNVSVVGPGSGFPTDLNHRILGAMYQKYTNGQHNKKLADIIYLTYSDPASYHPNIFNCGIDHVVKSMEPVNFGDLFSVKGRVALVTGGSSGIGFMISQGLVSNGAKVYICGLPSDPIEEKVRQLNDIGQQSKLGGSCIGFPGDVSTKAGITKIADHITSRELHLDMLISNAGIRRDPPLACDVLTASLSELQASMWSSVEEDWVNTFRINTTAHYYLSVALLPLLAKAGDLDLEETGPDGEIRRWKGRDEGRGVVVVTSSCASMHNCTNVDLTSYATSKAATDHLVALLASKFARWYVRVCGINPGFVPSNMNPIGAEGNIFANLFDKVPAKRPGGTADVAGAVLYLCSQAGAYVDGRCLCVDGGRVLVANGQE